MPTPWPQPSPRALSGPVITSRVDFRPTPRSSAVASVPLTVTAPAVPSTCSAATRPESEWLSTLMPRGGSYTQAKRVEPGGQGPGVDALSPLAVRRISCYVTARLQVRQVLAPYFRAGGEHPTRVRMIVGACGAASVGENQATGGHNRPGAVRMLGRPAATPQAVAGRRE